MKTIPMMPTTTSGATSIELHTIIAAAPAAVRIPIPHIAVYFTVPHPQLT